MPGIKTLPNTKCKENDVTPKTIMDLPDKIMLKIIFSMNQNFILKVISLVCKRWKKLTENKWFWKTLTFNFNYENLDWDKLLIKYPFVQKLTIKNCNITKHKPLFFSAGVSGLLSLELIKCYLDPKDAINIEPVIIKGSPLLSSVIFNECKSCNEFLYQALNHRSLKKMSIQNCNGFYKDDFISFLARCTKLEDVSITDGYHCAPNDEAVNAVFKNLSSSLIRVELYVVCDEGSFLNLCDCSKLLSLGIFNCSNLSDNILFQIKDLSSLISLSMLHCANFTTVGFAKMFNEKKLINLKKFRILDCPGLSSFNLISMASCCPKLTYLELYNCQDIGDEGLSSIVQHCPNLLDLRILSCHRLKGQFILDIRAGCLYDLEALYLDKRFQEEHEIILNIARPSINTFFS